MTVDYKEIAKAWDEQKPSGRSGGKSFWLAIRTAIEKQIPKKPSLNNRRIQCVNGHNLPIQHYKYCPFCGQMIDWK